jgi:microcystin degradation protein MlrC
MRIALMGLAHEANTFSSTSATLSQFEAAGIHIGEEMVAQFGSSQSTVGGFLAVAEIASDIELVPLLFTHITPMGTITAEAFEHLVGRMQTMLAEQGPWDAVLLALHGAAVSEQFPDADGEIVRRVRAQVGPGLPIGVSLDMHANVSPLLVANADVVTVYQTNPHVDAFDQARVAGELVVRAVRGEIRPVLALETLPVAINILRQGTDDSPMKDLLAAADQESARAGVLSVSLVEGFPYADVEHMGMSVLAVADADDELARDVVSRLADAMWAARPGYVADGWPPDDALRHAAAADRAPVILLDTGDNIGGGSPGDSTYLLEAAQRLGIPGLFIALADPESVAECIRLGVGAAAELDVGGKSDHRHGSPVRVRGRVRLISDGKWDDPTPTHGGFRFFDTGPTVLLATDDGHHVLLTSRPQGTVSQQQLRAVGLDPTALPIIVAKGVHSPRAAFEPIAAELIYVATPGATSADLSTFTYRRRRRPMFPYEANVSR